MFWDLITRVIGRAHVLNNNYLWCRVDNVRYRVNYNEHERTIIIIKFDDSNYANSYYIVSTSSVRYAGKKYKQEKLQKILEFLNKKL